MHRSPLLQVPAPSAADAAARLPPFFHRLATALQQEHGWCSRVLTAHRPALMTMLLQAIFAKLQQPLNSALLAPGLDAATLESLQQDVLLFVRNVIYLVQDAPEESLNSALRSVVEPWDGVAVRYATWEGAQLRQELSRTAAVDMDKEELESAGKAMAASLKAAFGALGEALER